MQQATIIINIYNNKVPEFISWGTTERSGCNFVSPEHTFIELAHKSSSEKEKYEEREVKERNYSTRSERLLEPLWPGMS